MREIGVRTLALEIEAKTIQLPSCFGSKEFNERTNICKSCDKFIECREANPTHG